MDQFIPFLSAVNLAGVISALAAWRSASKTSKELTHNHGSSTKDAITRIEKEQIRQSAEIKGIKKDVDHIVRLIS